MAGVLASCTVVSRRDDDGIIEAHFGGGHISGIKVATEGYYRPLSFQLELEDSLAGVLE